MRIKHLSSRCLFAALGTAGLGTAAEANSLSTPVPVIGPTDGSLPASVFGADGRQDYYQISDPNLKLASQATAALIRASDLASTSGNGTQSLTGSALETLTGEKYGVCADEKFTNQPTGAWCSGVLVAPDRILTAGHCVTGLNDCLGMKITFDYRLNSASAMPLSFAPSSLYQCSAILARAQGDAAHALTQPDYALVQLDRPVTDRTPIDVDFSHELKYGDIVYMTGHPTQLPLKAADGQVVNLASSPVNFTATLDSFGGNSGSPILNAKTFKLEGILIGGQADFQYDSAAVCYRSAIYPDKIPSGSGTNPNFVAETAMWATSVPGLEPPPPPVQGLALRSATDSTLLFGWNSGGGTTVKYRVAVLAGAAAPASCFNGVDGVDVTRTLQALSPMTSHSLAVCAVNKSGTTSQPIFITATTHALPPPAVRGLALNSATDSSLGFSWSSGGGSTALYRIAGVEGTTPPLNCLDGTDSPASSFTLSGLAPLSSFSISVCAKDATGGLSTPVSLTANTSAVPIPSGLTATPSGKLMLLNWAPGPAGVKNIMLGYHKGGGTTTGICPDATTVTLLPGATSIAIDNLQAGKSYVFSLCLTTSGGNVSAPNRLRVDMPQALNPPPAGVAVSILSQSSALIAWQGTETRPLIVGVQKGGSTATAICTMPGMQAVAAGHSFLFGHLSAGRNYIFVVCAKNADGTLTTPVQVRATTSLDAIVAPPMPAGLVVTTAARGSVSLAWKSSGGSTDHFVVSSVLGTSYDDVGCAGANVLLATAHMVSGLARGKHYVFAVCAVNAAGIPSVATKIRASTLR